MADPQPLARRSQPGSLLSRVKERMRPEVQAQPEYCDSIPWTALMTSFWRDDPLESAVPDPVRGCTTLTTTNLLRDYQLSGLLLIIQYQYTEIYSGVHVLRIPWDRVGSGILRLVYQYGYLFTQAVVDLYSYRCVFLQCILNRGYTTEGIGIDGNEILRLFILL